jgi:hypothetical protein
MDDRIFAILHRTANFLGFHRMNSKRKGGASSDLCKPSQRNVDMVALTQWVSDSTAGTSPL